MKLLIAQAMIITLLFVSFSHVKTESLSNTVFDLLNNFIGMGSPEPEPYQNFRFMSIHNRYRNGTSNSTAAPTSEGTSTNSSAAEAHTSSDSYVVNLNDPNTQINDWLSISSHSFVNSQKFPHLTTTDGRALIDLNKYERQNGNYEAAQNEGAPASNTFWFKARGGYIYYSSTKQDINVLDAIFAKEVKNNDKKLTPLSSNSNTCFNVLDYSENTWTLCAVNMETKLKWLCSLQAYLNQELDYICTPPSLRNSKVTLPETPSSPAVEVKKVVQPVIIIPMASKSCNEKWTYVNKGKDWECTCKEGRDQSPIDLPTKEAAILSPLKPLFQYDVVSATASDSSYDGLLIAGESVKIRYDKGAVRIYHTNLGKIVTLDGGVYIAEEISFHTPSEHKINGQSYDMEMQIVHYGRTKGDIAKQVVLSFLFKKTPGVYNKFLDKLDFFNLPNPVDDYRDLTQDFYIPSVFYTTEDDNISTMQPFSFYTYEGSLTRPPCSERTTHYVAADPIPLSNTVITLFKEALKKPDMVNVNEPNDIIINDEGNIENNREIQPLNGRSVYVFDHKRYGCIEYIPKKKKIKPAGHYEKVQRDATEYIYVNGKAPSGLPGSFIVSEKEAKGSLS